MCSCQNLYSPPVQEGLVCKWADDSQRFILEHFDTISHSPSQVYHSALLLSPSSSWLHGCYSLELLQVPKLVTGDPEWGTCSRTTSFGCEATTLACWGDIILVGLRSGSIAILDAITGTQVSILSGHTDWVRSL